MSTVLKRLSGGYACATRALPVWLGSLVLLLMRIWVAIAFWRAGVVKFEDPTGTLFLFNVMYQVPLLPAGLAAVLATWIELIVPWFVGLGLLGRLSALFLFIYNIIAFSSFPALWPHGFWTGLFSTTAFTDHKIWGLMLLAVVAWGPGLLSVDGLCGFASRLWQRQPRRKA